MTGGSTEKQLEADEREAADRIEESVEVGEDIGAAFERIDRHKQYAHTGGTAVVEGIESVGESIDAGEISGADFGTSPEEVPEQVAVTYRAPDGTMWRAVLPFPTGPGTKLDRLFDYVGV